MTITTAQEYLDKCIRQLKEPWSVGFRDRGMGHGDYGVLDSRGELVADDLDGELAQHLVDIHNQSLNPESTVPKLAESNRRLTEALKIAEAALRKSLISVDEAYASTGHFRIAETSVVRVSIGAAIGVARAALAEAGGG